MAGDSQVRDARTGEELGTKLRKLIRFWPFEAWVIALVAVVMVVVGLVGAAGESVGIWFELARAGLGVFAVAFLGGAAAASFRSRELDRENARRRDEYRAAFVSELWDAYHEIKAVRRALRAAGAGESAELNAEQAAVYQEQMGALDDAQLTLEKLFRTVRRERDVFTPYDRRLLFLLRTAEDYVNHVLKDWEHQQRKHLPSFLGPAKQTGGIKRELSVALERASELIYALRSESTVVHETEPEIDCDLLWPEAPLPEDKARDAEKPDCERAKAAASVNLAGGAADASAPEKPTADMSRH